jgi:hypothetical protein
VHHALSGARRTPRVGACSGKSGRGPGPDVLELPKGALEPTGPPFRPPFLRSDSISKVVLRAPVVEGARECAERGEGNPIYGVVWNETKCRLSKSPPSVNGKPRSANDGDRDWLASHADGRPGIDDVGALAG